MYLNLEQKLKYKDKRKEVKNEFQRNVFQKPLKCSLSLEAKWGEGLAMFVVAMKKDSLRARSSVLLGELLVY